MDRKKKPRQRKNHVNTSVLLDVPHTADYLKDLEAEDEESRGRALVSAPDDWRLVTAKWMLQAREEDEHRRANEDSGSSDEEDDTPLPTRNGRMQATKWKKTKLNKLFGGAKKCSMRVEGPEMDAEIARMEAVAELEEDHRLDDGAVEISDDDVYGE